MIKIYQLGMFLFTALFAAHSFPQDKSKPVTINCEKKQHIQDEATRKRCEKLQALVALEMKNMEERLKKSPKKVFPDPSNRNSLFREYYEKAVKKIEVYGTQNFPEIDGEKLYGQVVISAEVDPQGQVLLVMVEESSGNQHLDRYARNTIYQVAPFDQFNDAQRAHSDRALMLFNFRYLNDHIGSKPDIENR